MTTKAAEDFEDIARRLKELEADRQLALTGSTVPEPTEAPKDIYWPGMCGVYMTPGAFNDAARQYMAYKQGANQYNANSLAGLGNGQLSNYGNPYK